MTLSGALSLNFLSSTTSNNIILLIILVEKQYPFSILFSPIGVVKSIIFKFHKSFVSFIAITPVCVLLYVFDSLFALKKKIKFWNISNKCSLNHSHLVN